MKLEYQTDRLILRQWMDEDREPFSRLNNNPVVMQFFPRMITPEMSDEFIDRNIAHISETGWGAWAVELVHSGRFIGFVGFSRPAPWHPCAGMIDIGWRLNNKYWGHGYATEAAGFATNLGFTSFGFNELVSFTSACNLRSISVMEKLGMRRSRSGFDHPRIEKNNLLRAHVVFRISKYQWDAAQQQTR